MTIKRVPIITFLCIAGFAFLFCSPSFSDEEKPSQPQIHKSSAEQVSYVYDLKSLIEKSKNNIKRVNEKIKEQTIYKRNMQREDKAREYYDRATHLFEEGKVDEARELYEKSIRITENPEMKNYFKISEKKFKTQTQAMRKEEKERLTRAIAQERERQRQVQDAYEEGVALYKRQNFKAARDKFILVEQMIPEFKGTRSYLKLLEVKIAGQDKLDTVNQNKENIRKNLEADAASMREKDLWRKELVLKEQERQRKLMDQAQSVYAEAAKFYKDKNFIAAKEKFQEVEWVVPDYKSTRQYLEKLDKDIKVKEHVFAVKKAESKVKEEWRDELTRKKLEAQQKKEFEARSADEKQKAAQEASVHYQAANEMMAQKQYAKARDGFLTVQKIYPDFKASETHLARLNKMLGIIENAPDKVENQVKAIYADGILAYKEKNYSDAKLKFDQVEFMYPDYMAARKYLSKLEKQSDVKKPDEQMLEAGLVQASDDPMKAAQGMEVDKEGYKILVDKAEPVYVQALALYEEKKFDEALKQFEIVENTLPNYKAARPYIKRVNHQIKKVEQLRYKEEQTQQAETINILAKQASVLYAKIAQLSDDRSTSEAQKKFAFVDRLFATMSKEQAKLLKEIALEEEKLRLEEIAYEQEVQQSEFVNAIDPVYQEAVRLYQAKKYDEAKAKFLEAQTKIADYRSSKRYLSLIDKQNQLLQQTMKDRERQIAQFESKAQQSAELAAKMQLKTQETAMIHDLVSQAEEINDQIVALSKDRNFEAIKEKFAELEKIVDNLLTIKIAVAQRENTKPPIKYDKAGHSKERKQEAKPEKSEEDSKVKSDVNKQSQIDAEENEKTERNRTAAAMVQSQKSLTERRRIQREKANHQLKLRQITRQNRDVYHKALRSFYAGNYSDAKTRFLQLEQSAKYGVSAYKYVEKISQITLQKQNSQIVKQDKQRKEYIQNRAERERVRFKIQEADRGNKFHSSRGVMDSTLVPSTLMYPPARQEYLGSLSLRARNPAVTDIVDQEQVAQMKDTPPVTEPDDQADETVEGLSPNEDASWLKRHGQKKLSDRRKKYFEEKQKAEQKRKEKLERQEVRVWVSSKSTSASQMKSAIKLSERQRLQEEKLRKLYDQELRQSTSANSFDNALSALEQENKKKSTAGIEAQKNMLRQQREEEKSLRQEKERKISTIINQGQRTSKIPLRGNRSSLSSEENSGPTLRSNINDNFSENLDQSPISSNKDSVRKKFNNGLAQMYAEALDYYRNRKYKEARDRFSDVEDISPDYKRTRSYLGRIDEEVLQEQKRREKIREDKQYNSVQPIDVSRVQKRSSKAPSEPVENRLDEVSKALDDFETKIK